MSLRKRSFTIQGHRTSIALEPEFWAAFDRAVLAEGATPTALITRLDEERDRPLASAVRVWLLRRAEAG